MNKAKDFDCVELKRAIQSQVAQENEKLSDDEIRRRRADWLATADHPAARLWRKIAEAQKPAVRD